MIVALILEAVRFTIEEIVNGFLISNDLCPDACSCGETNTMRKHPWEEPGYPADVYAGMQPAR